MINSKLSGKSNNTGDISKIEVLEERKITPNGENGIIITEKVRVWRKQNNNDLNYTDEIVKCTIDKEGKCTFILDNNEPTVIPEEFFYKLKSKVDVKLERIEIPDSIELIGKRAFKECEDLKEIVFGNKIRRISSFAFENTKQLREIELPNTIQYIGNNAFHKSGLTGLDLRNCKNVMIGEKAFALCKKLITVYWPFKRIPTKCFQKCSSLENVYVEDKNIVVGEKAFNGCKRYEITEGFPDINEPNSEQIQENNSNAMKESKSKEPSRSFKVDRRRFETINPKYFYDKKSKCWVISGSVRIPLIEGEKETEYREEEIVCKIQNGNGVFDGTPSIIPYQFFRNVKELKSITIPESVRYIEEGAFVDCDKLKNVNFLDGLITIGKGAFRESKVENVKFSKSEKQDGDVTIEDEAFSYCNKLSEISFSNRVCKIGNRAFLGSSINIADLSECTKLKIIGVGAFELCKNLKSIFLPNSVNKIPKKCCNGCVELTEVQSYARVINEEAFMGCSNLLIFELLDSGNNNELQYKNVNCSLIIYSYAFKGCEILQELKGWEGRKEKNAAIYPGSLSGCPLDLGNFNNLLENSVFFGKKGRNKMPIPINREIIPYIPAKKRISLEELLEILKNPDVINPELSNYECIIKAGTELKNKIIQTKDKGNITNSVT